MSDLDRQSRHKMAGFEYWASRLHSGGERPGRTTKVRTHRRERRLARLTLLTDPERLDTRASF